MSEMMRNRGIVKRLSTPETADEVLDKLVESGEVRKEHCEYYDGKLGYIDNDKYEVVNGSIFDVSGAPDEYDSYDDINEAVKLNDTDYRVHAYYYNGGACFSEMLEESIPLADKTYVAQYDPKSILREALLKAKVTELEAFVLIQQIYEENENE